MPGIMVSDADVWDRPQASSPTASHFAGQQQTVCVLEIARPSPYPAAS